MSTLSAKAQAVDPIIVLDPEFEAFTQEWALLGVSPGGIIVFDIERSRCVGINHEMCRILRWDHSQVQAEDLNPLVWVHPDDHALFYQATELSPHFLHAITNESDPISVEAHCRLCEIGGTELWVYFVQLPLDSEKLQKEFRAEIEEHKERTANALRSSLRIYQITEKMLAMPRAGSNLLEATTEEELFKEAVSFITAEGLNAKDASIYLLEEDSLRLAYSTMQVMRKKQALNENNRFGKFLATQEQPADRENCLLAAIRCGEEVLGILEVILDPREDAYFAENKLVAKWQSEHIDLMAEKIGLYTANLRLYETVKQQSIKDPLTGAYNRHYLLPALENELKRSERHKEDISLLFIDIDNFKHINDNYGHAQGDLALVELTKLVKLHFRETDLVIRFGGDEFVIIMPLTEINSAEDKAIKFCELVSSHVFPLVTDPQESHSLSVSAGLVANSDRSVEELLQVADMALYGAKGRGKNQVYRISTTAESENA